MGAQKTYIQSIFSFKNAKKSFGSINPISPFADFFSKNGTKKIPALTKQISFFILLKNYFNFHLHFFLYLKMLSALSDRLPILQQRHNNRLFHFAYLSDMHLIALMRHE